MTKVPNIILVGPMGAGKTTIGRLISQSMGKEFYDLDKVIEDNAGADISWIFEKEGEDGFRRRETQALADIVQSKTKDCVLATGGGIVMREENRDILHENALVVYLYA